jgi:sugar phosphate isomerase/epimerase
MFSRRNLFNLGAAGAAALAAGGGAARTLTAANMQLSAAGGKKMIPIGLQLYSVRSECAKDPAGTIAAVAKMGYKAVEFAGYYNQSAADLRKILDANGLACCGTHTALATLLGDELAKTIEFNKTLGNPFLIVPGLPKERTASKKAWQDTAALFNELADKVKPHGMRVGYHNHTIEFKALDGELPWDTFFGNTKKEVIMQFDTGNAMIGGGDPVVFLKKYPGRAVTVHLKPFSKSNPKAVIGEDELPWKEIFDLCETTGGTQWYIVEYEVAGVPALEAVAKCLEGLRKMGKA